ncbi:hypothetical protein [Natronorubrum thiooxidans]|uniref:Uncharacterized protein n=1 Tax=Natronorubrum thiooxidans TaxID=308853 RepID=A0A1N7GR13_9EURY|nr:hypothetical protein [Natronorubrum thiooxidans]SIS15015.1 hypothetical protein SAMN05421752_11489 [Natronorubrum thiooxidans]
MHRRQYLARAGAGVGTLTALAGCLGDGSDGGGDVADRTGERALDRATGTLNEAALALQIDDSIDDPETIDFDPAEPNGLIDDARDRLETAAAELDADRQSEVDELRTYADILEGLVVVTDTVTDETLGDDVDTVTAAINEDGDLEAATDTLDDRTARLDTAQTRYGEAEADFAAFEKERFEDLARIDYTELEDGIATLGDVVGSLSTLGDGFESMLEGYEDLEQGRTHLEDERYNQAEMAFVDAESDFATATAVLEGDEDPPSGLVSYFETATCQNERLTAAAAAFEDGAGAAAAGDPITAQERQDDGEQKLEAACDCSQ